MKPYYEQDGITIYNGDCRDVLPSLDRTDRVIVDPPYGLGINYGAYVDTRKNLAALIDGFMPWALEYARSTIVLPGITQVHCYPAPVWMMAVCWNTTGSFGAYGYTQWMPVLCYGADIAGFGNVNNGAAMKSDVIVVNGGSGVGVKRDRVDHPCPKPINVMDRLVQRLTRPSETIVDPCMGSGTTLVSAKRHGRKAVGIEINEQYCEIAAQRLAQRALFGAEVSA